MARDDGDDEGDTFDDLLQRAARLTPLPTPARAIAALEVGSEVYRGRFRVERRIGEGGMGVVYAAFDREKQRRVALKTLSRLDADGIYRLKSEFRALSDVVHPNLVRLDELWFEDGRMLFSMELVGGVPFDQYVRPGAQHDGARLRRALSQLVVGVHAIHAAGKLHRDLKPSNVLVDEDGRLTILDFGLAADPEAGGVGQTVDTAWVAGTPAYMAPEQAAGDAIGPAADWYAVGVMLFEALTGALPFDGKPGAIMAAKQVGPAPSPRLLEPGSPDDLAQLCDQLLARDPGARPAGDALTRTWSGDPVAVAMPASRPTRDASALFGREAERSAIHAAFVGTQRGRASLIRLGGASGLGKSALAAAVLAELDDEAVVLHGRCYEKEALPFNAFDSLVDELSRHLRRLPYADAAGLMPRDVRALARIFPVLERHDAVGATPLRPFSDEHELRRRAFDALTELLARMRDRSPLVIHVDDLQWADEESTRLFQHLMSQPEPAPILWIASHRELEPGDHGVERVIAAARDNPKLLLTELELGALDIEAATLLASSLLPDDSPLEVARRIAEEAAGNPFLIVELSRHVSEGGQAAGASLEQALGARFDRLEPEARRALDLLALCGRPMAAQVVADALDDTSGDVHRGLDALRAAQLVHASASHGIECYHDRIRQVVLAQLADADGIELHRRMAKLLSTRPEADPEVLFEHCRAAGMPTAGQHAARAAARAITTLAFERAAELWAQAIELADETADLSALWERRAEALSLAGRWAQAADCFDRAHDLARDDPRRAYLLQQCAGHYLGSGHPAEGLPRLRRVLSFLGLGWPRTKFSATAGAIVRLAWLWLTRARHRLREVDAPMPFDGLGRTEQHRYVPDHLGQLEEAVRVEALMASAGLVPHYDLWRGLYFATAFVMRALRHGEASRMGVALGLLSMMFAGTRATLGLSRRLGAEAARLAREGLADNLKSGALTSVSLARLFEGDLDEALKLGDEASFALRHAGRAFAYEAWSARTSYALAMLRVGRYAECKEVLALSTTEARELGDELATLGGELIFGYLIDDDVDGARALLERKRKALVQTGEEGVLGLLVYFEEIVCALYCGEGAAALALTPPPTLGQLARDFLGPMWASCALQAAAANVDRDAQLKTVRRIAKRLARQRSSATAGMALQLDAALALADGDRARAVELLERACERYQAVSMPSDALSVRYYIGTLRGGVEGERQRDEACALMRARGLANPHKWVRALAPGFEPQAAAQDADTASR